MRDLHNSIYGIAKWFVKCLDPSDISSIRIVSIIMINLGYHSVQIYYNQGKSRVVKYILLLLIFLLSILQWCK